MPDPNPAWLVVAFIAICVAVLVYAVAQRLR